MDAEARDKLLEKAYKLGFEYEKIYKGCSQCVIAAIQDTLDIKDDSVFKAGTGLAGGGGLTGIGFCGGYSGAVMMLSLLYGRERSNFADPEKRRFRSFELARRFAQLYTKELGSIICRDIQYLRFGRPYYIADADEHKKFEEAAGHTDQCTTVVGTASRLAVQFILDENLLGV